MTFPFPDMPPRPRNTFEVRAPNLGLYTDRSELDVPDRGMTDCLNVRVRSGRVTNENMGYELFFTQNLGQQVLGIETFKASNGSTSTIFGTKSDLFRYDSIAEQPRYITPTYSTGTATSPPAPSSIILGTGTSWLSEVKAGDFFHLQSATQNDPAALWYEIASVDSDTQITLVSDWGGTGSIVDQLYTIRKTFTAEDTDIWVGTTFPDAPIGTTSGYAQGDRWIATNGKEVVAWDGNSSSVTVISTSSTGLGFSCTTLAYYKNMILFGNIVEGGTSKPVSVKHTAIGDPENVTTLEANEFAIAEGVDFLRALVPLGNIIVGYCENSVNVAEFVSAPFYFAIRTAAPRVGVYSPRCVVNFGDYHEFLGFDQAYRFDGLRLIPFGNHVFDEALRSADRSRVTKSLAILSEEDREVYWVIPLTTDNGVSLFRSADIAWTEHYAENVGRAPTPFTKRNLPATAAGVFVDSPVGRWSDFVGETFRESTFSFNDRFFTSSFPVLLMGDEGGNIYRVNTASQLGTSLSYPSFFTSPGRALIDGSSQGIIRRVEPYVRKANVSGDLLVFASTWERPNGDKETAFGSINMAHEQERFVPFRIPGRYGGVTFQTLFKDVVWSMDGYRVESGPIGDR